MCRRQHISLYTLSYKKADSPLCYMCQLYVYALCELKLKDINGDFIKMWNFVVKWHPVVLGFLTALILNKEGLIFSTLHMPFKNYLTPHIHILYSTYFDFYHTIESVLTYTPKRYFYNWTAGKNESFDSWRY